MQRLTQEILNEHRAEMLGTAQNARVGGMRASKIKEVGRKFQVKGLCQH